MPILAMNLHFAARGSGGEAASSRRNLTSWSTAAGHGLVTKIGVESSMTSGTVAPARRAVDAGLILEYHNKMLLMRRWPAFWFVALLYNDAKRV